LNPGPAQPYTTIRARLCTLCYLAPVANGSETAGESAGARKTVVVTGATGYVASQMLSAFRERYDLRLIDIARDGRGGSAVEDVIVHDLRDPNLEKHRALFKGAHAVVHLAYHRARGFRGYLDERINLDMAYHVYQLALEEGLERVVMASSNHAADWYEDLIHAGQKDGVSPDERPLARNFYGWAKAAYEHMGFLYAQGSIPAGISEGAAGGAARDAGAAGRSGGGVAGGTAARKVGVVQVRIGHPRALEHYDFTGRPQALKRNLGAFISARDISQLFCKAIETPNIENEHGIPFQIVYGISDNTRAFWSLANARRVLGYAPQDDSELLYAETIQRVIGDSPGRVGNVPGGAAPDPGGAPARRT
jgi:hypothetical protein